MALEFQRLQPALAALHCLLPLNAQEDQEDLLLLLDQARQLHLGLPEVLPFLAYLT